MELVKGASIRLTTDRSFENSGTAINLFVDYANITKVLSPGHRIYIDDGLISLIVDEIGSHFMNTAYQLSLGIRGDGGRRAVGAMIVFCGSFASALKKTDRRWTVFVRSILLRCLMKGSVVRDVAYFLQGYCSPTALLLLI